MKLNLNFKLKGLDDKELQNSEVVSKILANALAVDNDKEDPLKFMEMASTLYNKGEIELDRSDLTKLKEKIKKHDGFTNLLKAAILEAIIKTESNG